MVVDIETGCNIRDDEDYYNRSHGLKYILNHSHGHKYNYSINHGNSYNHNDIHNGTPDGNIVTTEVVYISFFPTVASVTFNHGGDEDYNRNHSHGHMYNHNCSHGHKYSHNSNRSVTFDYNCSHNGTFGCDIAAAGVVHFRAYHGYICGGYFRVTPELEGA